MRIEVTVRVRNSNDPDNQTYTYKKVSLVRFHEFSRQVLINLIKEAQIEHHATLPYNHNLPVFCPTTVTVREIDK